MKTKIVIIGLLAVICILAVGATAKSALAASPALTWEQVNVDGFGDTRNFQIQAMEVYDGYLYAGVIGWAGFPTTMSQIWRTADGKQWELVRDTNDAGLRDFVVFNNYLYASTWNGKILRTLDGLNWEVTASDIFPPGFFSGVMRFEVYKGMLYGSAQDMAQGLEIWRSADGFAWEKVVDNGFDDPGNGMALTSAVFKGKLYWGTFNFVTATAELWRSDGTSMEALPNFGSGNLGIAYLIADANYLYANTVGFEGSKIWRSTDGLAWENITGSMNSFSFEPSSMIIHKGKLYLFSQNILPSNFSSLGVDGWLAGKQGEWEKIASGGLGDTNNDAVLQNASVSFKGNLYIGISNAMGVEVWRMCEGICN